LQQYNIEKQSVDNDKLRDSANNASEMDTPFQELKN